MGFKEWLLTEGTQAAIIVRTNDDKYSMSYSQYDGYLEGIGAQLKKYFKTQKNVDELVSNSGEIRGIDKGKIEFYAGRKLLKTNLSEDKVIDEANSFAQYKYYFNGVNWYYSTNKISSLDDMKQL